MINPTPLTGWMIPRVGKASQMHFRTPRPCDFKVRDLGPKFEHEAYDLKKAFDLGYKAGFRGPWCTEHATPDKATMMRNIKWVSAQLRAWTAASGK